MHEVDFLAVGQAGRHGDAIAIRLTRPDTGGYVQVVIDAGFEESGTVLANHVKHYFGTRSVDIAILTHPDADHIGGMGKVIRELDVGTLCVHRLGERGGPTLPAAEAVDELIALSNLAALRSTSRSLEHTDWAERFRSSGRRPSTTPNSSPRRLTRPKRARPEDDRRGLLRPSASLAIAYSQPYRSRCRSAMAAAQTRGTTRPRSLSLRWQPPDALSCRRGCARD
jgi:Metallo-beta-lactamase superfamily